MGKSSFVKKINEIKPKAANPLSLENERNPEIQ